MDEVEAVCDTGDFAEAVPVAVTHHDPSTLSLTLGGAGARTAPLAVADSQTTKFVGEILSGGRQVLSAVSSYDLSRWLCDGRTGSRVASEVTSMPEGDSRAVSLPSCASWAATLGVMQQAGAWGYSRKHEVTGCGLTLGSLRKPIAIAAAEERVARKEPWINFDVPSSVLGRPVENCSTVVSTTYHTTTARRYPPDGSAVQKGSFVGTCALHASNESRKKEIMSSCLVQFWQGPDAEEKAHCGAAPAVVFGRHGRADTGVKAEQLSKIIDSLVDLLGCNHQLQPGAGTGLLRRSCRGHLRVRTMSLLNAISLDPRECGFFRWQCAALTETKEQQDGRCTGRKRKKGQEKGEFVGTLVKQGAKRKSWKVRVFKLDAKAGVLQYFVAAKGGKPGKLKGSIRLPDIMAVCNPEQPVPSDEVRKAIEGTKEVQVGTKEGAWESGLDVRTPTRVFRLVAETEAKKVDWMYELEKSCPGLQSREAVPALIDAQVEPDPDMKILKPSDVLAGGTQWGVLGVDGSLEDTCAVSEAGDAIVWRGGRSEALVRSEDGGVSFLGVDVKRAYETSGRRVIEWADADIWEDRVADFDFSAAMGRMGVEHAYLNMVANWPLCLPFGWSAPHGRHNATHGNALRRHLVWLAQDVVHACELLPPEAKEKGTIALRVLVKGANEIAEGHTGDDPWGPSGALFTVREALGVLKTAARYAGPDAQERASELFMAAECLRSLSECKGLTFRKRAQEILQLAVLERVLGVVATFNCKSGIDRCGCLSAIWTTFYQLLLGGHGQLWKWFYLAMAYPVVVKTFHKVPPCDNSTVPVKEFRENSDLRQDSALPFPPKDQDYEGVLKLLEFAEHCEMSEPRSRSPQGRCESDIHNLLERLFYADRQSILPALHAGFLANQLGVTTKIAAASTGVHGLKYGDRGVLANALSAQFMPASLHCAECGDAKHSIPITEVRRVMLSDEVVFTTTAHSYIVGASSGRGT